ncbi:MAG: hypothetical protein ACT4OX_04575 [Actinomycetota bacterium]
MILFAVALAAVGPTVDVDAKPIGDPPAVVVADNLGDGDVLRVQVHGLSQHARAEVRQCPRDGDANTVTGCHNEFPVQADVNGDAQFQYQILGDGRTCGPTASCVLVVTDGAKVAVVYTVFGGAAPPAATIRLEPDGPYRVGARVAVHIDGLATGARVGVSLCLPDCRGAVTSEGEPITFELDERCPRRERCRVFVTGLGARDSVRPLRFIAPAGADYDAPRVAVGLLVAAAFAMAAVALVRRTDWQPPTEAATPAMDAAEL